MSSSNNTIDLPQTPSVRSINFTILFFKVTDPQFRFIRLENHFLENRVHLQRDKFCHTDSLLPDILTDSVREILAKPDAEELYDVLK